MAPRKRAAASRSTEEDGEAGGGSKDAKRRRKNNTMVSSKVRKTTVAKRHPSRKRAVAAETERDEEKGTSRKKAAGCDKKSTKEGATTTNKATTGKKATTSKKVPAAKKSRKAKKPCKPKNDGFNEVYQFKITLLDTKPRIWRRIQVPKNYTFKSLHEAIQDAMGWKNRHLHQFDFEDGTIIGPPWNRMDMGIEEPDDKPISENRAIISNYFFDENMDVIYEYDFGDEWEHQVLFEKAVKVEPNQVYPRCLGGKRACPPEDIGGIDGYEDFLKMINKTPSDSRDQNMQPVYDPDYFDVEQVKFRDSRTGSP